MENVKRWGIWQAFRTLFLHDSGLLAPEFTQFGNVQNDGQNSLFVFLARCNPAHNTPGCGNQGAPLEPASPEPAYGATFDYKASGPKSAIDEYILIAFEFVSYRLVWFVW